jgi:rRNA pseudouridine-1189 N-methylase Emg1 (Nep1/Mra1 family)
VTERELIEAAIARCLEVSPLLLAGEMHAAMLKLHTKEKPERPDGK